MTAGCVFSITWKRIRNEPVVLLLVLIISCVEAETNNEVNNLFAAQVRILRIVLQVDGCKSSLVVDVAPWEEVPARELAGNSVHLRIDG